MGLWKRVSEKTKQAIGLKATTPDWKPTSNARNLAMIEEARRFSKQLKTLHQELRDLESKISGNMTVLKSVLGSPLPRVYEMSDKGAVPVDKDSSMVGTGVSFEVLTTTAASLKDKLQQEVLLPLDQWQAAYRMIKQRNLKCEQLRLELDAQRRDTSAMAVSLEKMKTRAHAADAGVEASSKSAGAAAGPTGASNKLEDAEFKLQKEEDKVSRLTQRYKDIEEEVYTALLTLINDTKVLKQYAATALVVFQHAFAQAHTAFGSGELPVEPPRTAVSASTPNPMTKQRSMASEAASPPSAGRAGPETPEQALPPSTTPAGVRAAPSWYLEAKEKAQPMQYDSDDEH